MFFSEDHTFLVQNNSIRKFRWLRLAIIIAASFCAAVLIMHCTCGFSFSDLFDRSAAGDSAGSFVRAFVLLWAAWFFALASCCILLFASGRLLMVSVLFFLCTAVSMLAIMLIPQPLFRTPILYNFQNAQALLLLFVPIVATILILFAASVRSRALDLVLEMKQRILYVIVLLLFLVFAQYLLILSARYVWGSVPIHGMLRNLSVVFLLVLILSFAVIAFCWILGRQGAQNKLLSEQLQAAALDKKIFEHLIAVNESLREVKHDTQKHLEVIRSLAEQGDANELMDYIDHYADSLRTLHNLISTGNTAIDYVVSERMQRAAKEGISFTHKIITPERFPIDDVSLTSLLANLLDNAIEACLLAKHEDAVFTPRIALSIHPYHGMILIHCENTYNGITKQDADGTFMTVKTEPGHGNGLRTIQAIVDEADGFVNILPETERKRFLINILLPLPEADGEEEELNYAEDLNHRRQ